LTLEVTVVFQCFDTVNMTHKRHPVCTDSRCRIPLWNISPIWNN